MNDNFFTSGNIKIFPTVFLVLAFALFFSAAGRAYYTPRNPRYHERSARRRAPIIKRKRGAPDRLGPGRWTPEARAVLEDFLDRRGKSAPGYDEQKPPVATLSWEGVAFVHDTAVAVFARMVRGAHFNFSDEFWGYVPLEYGRQRLRAAYEQFSALPPAVWPDEPSYMQYRKGFLAAYRRMCADTSFSACRILLTQVFDGYHLGEARDYARSVIRDDLTRPMGEEKIGDSFDDPDPIEAPTGLREVPEIKKLISVLLAQGVDVWIIDADPQVVLQAAAIPDGVDRSRIIGIQSALAGDRLTGMISGPVPVREFKTAALAAKLGRPPDLVIGASEDDEALMSCGKGPRLLIDHGDKALRSLAEKKGWVIQPAFGP